MSNVIVGDSNVDIELNELASDGSSVAPDL